MDVDNAALKDNKSQVNNMFLLGAGFTKALAPNAPLNADLVHLVIQDNPESLLRRYEIRYHTDAIEILLTRLDLEISEMESKRLLEDRKSINAEIAEYFAKFRFGKIKQQLTEETWLESLANDVFARDDAIITLNYDCLLDGVLDSFGVWSPSTGYAEVEVGVPGTDFAKCLNQQNILIYKIHGSENFHTTRLMAPDVDLRHIGLVVNEEIYPKSGKCSKLGVVNSEPYIIAPSFVKGLYPQIELMILRALQAAGQAKKLVIIGCSLRPEDSHLWLLLTKFLSQPTDGRRLIIVDPHATELVKSIGTHCSVDPGRFVRIDKSLDDGIKDLLDELRPDQATG